MYWYVEEMKLPLVLLACIVALLSLTKPIALEADECSENPTKEAFSEAAIVFVGRVTKVESLTTSDPSEKGSGKLPLERVSGADPYVATFAVEKVWKGRSAKSLQVLGLGRPTMGLGRRMKVGNVYVIYALDDLAQDSAQIASFAKKSLVYSLGGPCLLRISEDVAAETKKLRSFSGVIR